MKDWVIQTNIVSDAQAKEVARAVLSDNGRVFGADLIPFSDEIKFWLTPNTDELIPYGSTKLIQLAMKRGWKGVFFNDNFNVRTWLANHPKMLNKNTRTVQLWEVQNWPYPSPLFRPDGMYFIRPVEDLKPFAGTVARLEDIINWKISTVFGNFDVDENISVAISDYQTILSEQRWFIVDGKIIEGRQYRMNGNLCALPVTDTLIRMAQELAAMWLPHQTCVMDTAWTYDDLSVIEFNCLNCSGMYGHDPYAIVKAIQAME